MADYIGSDRDMQALYNERSMEKASLYSLYTEIDNAMRGVRPSRYDKLFSENEVPVEFRSVQLAAQDLTALTTKLFNIEVSPTGTSKARKDADERVEKIAYGWNSGSENLGGPSWLTIMGEIARLQVAFADGVLMFLPHYESKTLFAQVKDPRTHFPPTGWSPLSIVPLDETLIVYKTTLGQLKARYPDYAGALDNQYSVNRHGRGGNSQANDNIACTVGEFYAKGAWYVRTLDDKGVTTAKSEDGDTGHPGVCPVSSMRQMGFDPLFAGQLGLEVALQKVLSQEIQATDEMLHGPVTGSPLVGGDLVADRYNILRTDIPGDRVIPPQRLAPTSPLNTQRVIGELMSMLRIANRNPESFQGAGDANSAKAVQTLQAGIRSTVQDILWVPIMNALQDAYEKCRQMEVNLWPLERKTVQINRRLGRATKGQDFHEVSYRPITDLSAYKARIRVESDGELGGYQGSLDRQQKVASKLMPRRLAMEKDADIDNVQQRWQELQMESVDELWDQVVAAQGPALNPAGVARWLELMDEGKSKIEAYRQAQEEGAFTPPAPPELPGAEGGVPPELAQLLGGGAPELLAAPPSLQEARGF